MKKLVLFIAAVVVLAACSKKVETEISADKYNGYDQFLKVGEITKDLRIRGGSAGSVTYGLILDPETDDDFYPDPYFYVKYETTGDWELVKTHMYAGKWKYKPKNRRGNRKRFRFPHKTTFDPYVTTHTYKILLTDLPPYTEPGFIVATHARVYNPAKCGDNGYRHAWADWDRRFRCSGWGGYTVYFYEEPYEPHVNYYSVGYDDGDLNVYLVDATDGVYDTIFTETGVGSPTTEPDDGVSIDPNTGVIYFTNYNTGELYVNLMDEEDTPSYSLGTLEGTVKSAAFDDNTFYYVSVNDQSQTEIREVTISEDATTGELYFNSADDVAVGILPSTFTDIKDIAVDPLGSGEFYLVGEEGNGEAQLLAYDQTNQQLTNQVILDENNDPIDMSTDPQIAFTDDGDLYMVNAAGSGGDFVSPLTPNPGNETWTVDNPVIIVVPPGGGKFGTVTIN